MKKIILFLLFITGAVNAQIVNIPDANFKQKLLNANTTTNPIAKNQQGFYMIIDTNSDGEIQQSEALLVYSLSLTYGHVNSLEGISSFTNLQKLDCNNNNLTVLDVSSNINLISLSCGVNYITSINISGLSHLETLICWSNELTTLDLSGLNNLKSIICTSNQITSLDVSSLSNLTSLTCYNNQLTSLNLNGLVNLTSLNCFGNQLSNLDVSSLVNLTSLGCSGNQLSNLDVSSLVNLKSLGCSDNQLTSLDVTYNANLQGLVCNNNQLTSLDVSSLVNLTTLHCHHNQLVSLNIKNGNTIDFNNADRFSLTNNPNLKYICADETEINDLLQYATNNSMFGISINSYCSFIPGGDYNTITGTQLFDADNNGCDANDLAQPFVKININDGTNQGATFTNAAGNYKFYTQAGTFTVAPELENTSFFTINPNNAVVNFPDTNNNISTQNFCITANGIHPDLEVVITPITPARPGFDAVYKVVYKNKGNKTMTQQYGVSFSYNQNLMNFVSASTVPTTQNAGTINWDYTNLLPFESRSILVTMHINTPTDTNPVNINDVLNLTAIISPQNLDENVADNTFVFHQTVVGSYDPNDISCIEGATVDPSQIGKYLHYAINFENTGTALAENIVVKVVIDDTKFDVSSLQILNSSHPVYIRVKGNIAEFIFQNIQLNTNGHGNILLKIKTNDNLAAGDMVAKKADIFFDYNLPIETNIASTVFQSLGTGDFEKDNTVSIYPNPSNGIVNIKADNTIQSIALYDVQGRVLVTRLIKDVQCNLDISSYSGGVYFIKVFTDKAMKLEKIMKN